MKKSTLKRASKLLIVSTILLMTAFACKKYDDGPCISLRSKESRVTGKWIAKKIINNGVEENISILEYKWDFRKNGTIIINYKNISTGYQAESNGTWELINRAEVIEIGIQTSYSGISYERWNILRLKNDELWLELYDTGEKSEIHFTTQH